MGRFLERLSDALALERSTPSITAAAPVAVSRVAGVVSSIPPWGFGPPLQPFDVDAVAGWLMTRDAAMTLPTISRARDLICGAIAQLPITMWRLDFSQVPAIEARTPPVSWFDRPDPDRTRAWLLGWTADDLMFEGVAHWRVTSRFADTFPATFRRVAPGGLDVRDDHALVTDPDYNGGRPERVELRDIVQFQSPIEGLLSNGGRAISIALQLDGAADRFAGTELPTGILEEQDGSEDLTSDELRKLADDFALARRLNTTAATNKHVRYREIDVDASKMQLVEGRTYQALELARLSNIPPYLVGAPAGTGMTYLNGQQARQDLVDFGAAPYVACIEQTLSGPNVTPRGTLIRLDLNVWLRNPFTTPANSAQSPNDLQIRDDDTVGDTQTTAPEEVPT
jgi:hypothetical protein